MIRFLVKGLLRDRQRSLFPILVVIGGVTLCTLFYGFMEGVYGDALETAAITDTGHVKVMSRAYAERASQIPNDLALSGVDALIADLEEHYPQLDCAARIKFGGLLDFPDETGETRSQGPFMGIALDMLQNGSGEVERLNLRSAIVEGRLPHSAGEIVISDKLARKLDARVGEMATLISVTANSSMAIQNFTLVGTIGFGVSMLDRNLVLADISDVQYALDMTDGAGEILGFLPNMVFDRLEALRITQDFNSRYVNSVDEYAPVMLSMAEQNDLGMIMFFLDYVSFFLAVFFIAILSLVLWNTGLMSGLRRFGEVGVRLALGESKGQVYRSLAYESMAIGIAASLIGTMIGMGLCYYLQEVGIDLTRMVRGDINFAFSDKMRARVTPEGFVIGFIPGLASMVIGTLIAGIGIFKRQTSQLFKELEA